MKLIELMQLPVAVWHSGQTHESVFRSYHLLEQVKKWLALGVPHEVILGLIGEIETGPGEG